MMEYETSKKTFNLERMIEIYAQSLKTKETTEDQRWIDRALARSVLAWNTMDFESNPSAENFSRLELAMLNYQHWMKNVRLTAEEYLQKQVS